MECRAELTATVLQVLVAAGQTVEVGDDLLVLESMKMEIPVRAPQPGTVGDVQVDEGDQVDEGQVLVVIQSSS